MEKKSNVVSFVEYKALKEISDHFDIDFDSLKREKVTFNPDWSGEIDFDCRIDWDDIEDET